MTPLENAILPYFTNIPRKDTELLIIPIANKLSYETECLYFGCSTCSVQTNTHAVCNLFSNLIAYSYY